MSSYPPTAVDLKPGQYVVLTCNALLNKVNTEYCYNIRYWFEYNLNLLWNESR